MSTYTPNPNWNSPTSKLPTAPNTPFPFASRRSVVYSTKGMVASTQPLASAVGVEVLRMGGNAADAAVAVSAALNVTEPSCCGIGGDAFCLFFSAETNSVQALNGSGRAPAKLTVEHARKAGIKGSKIPLVDLNSVTIPGAAAAWADTIDRFGSGKLTLADVLAPAIQLAEEGVPVSEIHAHSWKNSESLLKTASPNGDEMLLKGRAPREGEIIKLPHLAETFRTLAKEGKRGFYTGRIAQAIVDLIQSKGGVMEMADLEGHETAFVKPIDYLYGDVRVYECPPNGQGITALMALGILESMQELGMVKPLLEMEHNSAEYLHTLIEALRLAFGDSQWYVTDPEVEHVPVEELLSKEYLTSRASLFDPKRTNPNVVHGNPVNSSDTVYFSGALPLRVHLSKRDPYSMAVTDRWGNACSFIQSNYAGFGTGAIPKGCGFTLQNRGSGFVLDDTLAHPNSLKGGKRPYHTIIPALATKNSDLFLSFGVMGGYMQPQGHVQVLLNILRGFSPQAALDAPRFCISAGTPDSEDAKTSGAAGDINSEVYLEDGISGETLRALREMGHDARPVSGFARGMLGRGQIIQKITDPSSGQAVFAAGSDPRGDGHAAPQL